MTMKDFNYLFKTSHITEIKKVLQLFYMMIIKKHQKLFWL